MLTALIAVTLIAQQPARPWATRAEFAKCWKQVKDWMPPEQVLAILGPPDDVWEEPELSFTSMRGPYEEPRFPKATQLWRYGCEDHFAPASLGSLTIHGGLVSLGDATDGGEHIADLPPEAKYRQLLAIIQGGKARPLRYVEIANALIPLGEKAAIAVLRESYNGVNWDVRYILAALYGAPKDEEGKPLYGIVLIGDLPCAYPATEGPSLGGTGGYMPHWEDTLSAFKKHGRFRTTPLTPPNDILELEPLTANLPRQALLEFQFDLQNMTETLFDWHNQVRRWSTWQNLRDLLKGKKTRFNREASRYQWSDGSYRKPPTPYKKLWSFENEEASGLDLSLYVQETETMLELKLIQEGALPESSYAEISLAEDGKLFTHRLDFLDADPKAPPGWNGAGAARGEKFFEAILEKASPFRGSLAVRIVSQGREIFRGPIVPRDVPRECQPLKLASVAAGL